MGSCLKKPEKPSRPELFHHTSMVDDDNNFYIDHNERLGTVMEVREEVEDVITVTSDVEA